MGNLPSSRTNTLVAGDPIPSALLNELQDQIIGNKHGPLHFGFFPTAWTGTGAPSAPVVNPAAGGIGFPVWKFTAGTTLAYTPVPTRIGSRLIGGRVSLYGDGAVDASAGFLYFPTPGSTTPTDVADLASTLNIAASWQLFTLVQNTPAVCANGSYIAFLVAATGANLHVGMVEPLWDRL